MAKKVTTIERRSGLGMLLETETHTVEFIPDEPEQGADQVNGYGCEVGAEGPVTAVGGPQPTVRKEWSADQLAVQVVRDAEGNVSAAVTASMAARDVYRPWRVTANTLRGMAEAFEAAAHEIDSLGGVTDDGEPF